MSAASEHPDLSGLRIREAARAVVLDPDHRVLLVRFEFPDGTRWALPGGGREPGESSADAVRRELVEEVGLHDADVGPHVWTRVHVIPFIDGSWDGQREEIHLVHAPRFDPAPALTAEQLEAELVFGMGWWTLDEIRTSDAVFAPRALADLLGDLLDGLAAGRVPNAPVDIGI